MTLTHQTRGIQQFDLLEQVQHKLQRALASARQREALASDAEADAQRHREQAADCRRRQHPCFALVAESQAYQDSSCALAYRDEERNYRLTACELQLHANQLARASIFDN